MSILIKGMKMPKKCSTCPFVEDDFLEDYFSPYCPLTGERPYGNERLNSCPLIELPPHGRLGDLDALIIDLMDRGVDGVQTDDLHEILQTIMDADTIIPAEGGCADNG